MSTDIRKDWKCSKCTFINKLNSEMCEICTTKKSAANWSCSVCTFENKVGDTVCGMCGHNQSAILQEWSCSIWFVTFVSLLNK